MLAALDDEILRLHISPEGEVWYADGSGEPIGSGSTITQFMEHPIFRRSPRAVRLLGVPANASLICQMYELALMRAISHVEVAGPLVCDSEIELQEPMTALFRMRQCLLHPSLGGWHVLSDADVFVYRLLRAFQLAGDVTTRMRLDFKAQQLWCYLSFIRGVSVDACIRLVMLIVDPRWFVSPMRPERIARLESFLGLTPEVQRIVTNRVTALPNAKSNRCALTLSAWKSGEPPSQSERAIPGNFLWRDWKASGGGVKGDLRASQRFVTYLRHTWMQSIVLQRSAGRPIEVFDPTLIFKAADELAGYRAHIQHAFDEYQARH